MKRIFLILFCSVAIATAAPKFVLPTDVTVGFTITGQTEFCVQAPPLKDNYTLQASVDGVKWFNTSYLFGPSSSFQSVCFSVTGTGNLQFRLRK
jgi:hypothetical protein